MPPAYAEQVRWMREDSVPRYTTREHPAGLILAGGRHANSGETYWRIAQYLMPNHSLAPTGAPGQTIHGQTWVPIDDTSCWIYTYAWNPERPITQEERAVLDRLLASQVAPRRAGHGSWGFACGGGFA